MDINELREIKKQSEKRIRDFVADEVARVQQGTGMLVTGIYISTHTESEFGGKSTCYVSDADIELKIF